MALGRAWKKSRFIVLDEQEPTIQERAKGLSAHKFATILKQLQICEKNLLSSSRVHCNTEKSQL